jgi:predicted RNase H-like HicB family nuclease
LGAVIIQDKKQNNYSLKVQEEEEVLKLLSESENSIISNIKSVISMHTALIFKEQAKVKEPRLREKG